MGYEAVFEQRPAQGRVTGERKYRGVARLTPTGELVETRLDVPARTIPPLGHTTVSQRYPRRQVDRIIQVVDTLVKDLAPAGTVTGNIQLVGDGR